MRPHETDDRSVLVSIGQTADAVILCHRRPMGHAVGRCYPRADTTIVVGAGWAGRPDKGIDPVGEVCRGDCKKRGIQEC